MLKLYGVTVPDETDSANAEFLMEIMEKNEEVEDAMTDIGKIKKLVQENDAVLKSLSM